MSEEMLSAREIMIREMNSLRGRLCTVIESAALPSKQEKALITLIKNISYQNQAVATELITRLEGNTDHKLQFRYIGRKLETDED